MSRPLNRRRRGLRGLSVLAGASLMAATPLPGTLAPAGAAATDYAPAPDLIPLLAGYNSLWTSDGVNDLHGTVKNAKVLAKNDELTVWINRHATKDQRFRALQNSAYDSGNGYDQSVSIADGLGSKLSKLYVKGRISGALPLTSALINSQTGSTGAFVSTSNAKAAYSYPRPYLPVSPDATPVSGDEEGCAPSAVNGSSVAANRKGKAYADEAGDLQVKRVPAVVDTTHEFSPNDVTLDPGYGTVGICTGGSFPSGHTTTAYEAAITLATLLPEVAPEILTRGSEAGNNRIVLGVHYPIDIMGGRIDGEAALATRWSDPAFRRKVLEPAREELVSYLEKGCGMTLAKCVAAQQPYTDDPYGGKSIPGGTAQQVTNRKSAVAVYTERLDYHLPTVGSTTLAASVPAHAPSLLRTTFPTLTGPQRRAVLAQTEMRSGSPLDLSGTDVGSWQRLNLAAATSATVALSEDGSVRVVSVGGKAHVVKE